MTETTTFRFERVERDCPANQNRRANGDTLHIIYDFEVWIDGEHRATFKKADTGKGYELHDADGRPLLGQTWRKHIGKTHVDKKAEFEATIQDKLALIPTLADMARMRDEEGADKARQEAAEREERLQRRIKAKGLDLFVALQDISHIAYSGDQHTINNDNAFAFATEMNGKLIKIRQLAGSAMAQTLENLE